MTTEIDIEQVEEAKKENQFTQDIIKLLCEFKDQRISLYEMLKAFNELKSSIKVVLPENKTDVRYKKLFEEKLKTITEFTKAELDIRKEIAKSIKDEIELRRRNSTGDLSDNSGSSDIDIRKIANAILSRKQNDE